MRYVLPILGLLLVVGGLAGVKAAQISDLISAGEAFQKVGPPPEAVATDFSRELAWEGTLSAVGSVAAERGVAISNESPGMVKRILFESGKTAKAGQVLVELDTSVERAQLATALARKELAEQTVTRTRSLVTSGGMTKMQLENDESQLKAATADVEGIQAQIARKVVRAPFAGKLGIREVNLGQYLSPGTTLTTLEALDKVYVDFSLPQQALASVQVGSPVRITLEGGQPLDGNATVAAVDPSVDRTTRTIQVRAAVSNEAQKLRPGMFARVELVLEKKGNVVALPITSVVHAPYGDSVFVVEPLKAAPKEGDGEAGVRQVRQQFVRLGEERGDFVAVVDGIKAGEEVVVAGAFKLRNGAKIKVDNTLKPKPELAPTPENR
jgi:membrane fusion protein (multidrug efflux system)